MPKTNGHSTAPRMVPNRPTLEGRLLGQELARLTDVAEQALRERFPHHQPRCESCAFRQGTVPNGCPETLMDALKCALEGVPFHCHEEMVDGQPTKLCVGWMLTQHTATRDIWQTIGREIQQSGVIAPWTFSTDTMNHDQEQRDA